MKNPTNPDSAPDSSASSAHLDATLMPMQTGNNIQSQLQAATNQHGLPGSSIGGSVTPSGGIGLGGGYGESNYEVFDPLNWMLDGLVDFPYSYAAVQGLEAQGMS